MTFVARTAKNAPRRRGGLLSGVTCLGQIRLSGDWRASADRKTILMSPDVEPGKVYVYRDNPCWAPENQTTIAYLLNTFGLSDRGALNGWLLSDGTVVASGSGSRWAAGERDIPTTFIEGDCGPFFDCLAPAPAAPPPEPEPAPEPEPVVTAEPTTTEPAAEPTTGTEPVPAGGGGGAPPAGGGGGDYPVYYPVGVQDGPANGDGSLPPLEAGFYLTPGVTLALVGALFFLLGDRDRDREGRR